MKAFDSHKKEKTALLNQKLTYRMQKVKVDLVRFSAKDKFDVLPIFFLEL
jgi:hypothetical protein